MFGDGPEDGDEAARAHCSASRQKSNSFNDVGSSCMTNDICTDVVLIVVIGTDTHGRMFRFYET